MTFDMPDYETDRPARIPRHALILTHNRPVELRAAVQAIAPQVDMLWVVDNASDPPVDLTGWPWPASAKTVLLHIPDQPPNLAALWNHTLDNIEVRARAEGAARWDVALLCDDVEVPPHWYDNVSSTMRAYNASAASTHKYQGLGQAIVKVRPDGDFATTMCGWCFLVPGEKGQRADETMKWWFLDTDWDWTARQADGMVLAPGDPAHNGQPNHWTNVKPELGEQAGRDREAFRAKWGSSPW